MLEHVLGDLTGISHLLEGIDLPGRGALGGEGPKETLPQEGHVVKGRGCSHWHIS